MEVPIILKWIKTLKMATDTNMFKIFIIFILVFYKINLEAQVRNINIEEAKIVAINQLYSEDYDIRRKSDIMVSNFGHVIHNGDTISYYFNFQPKGFVLVSATNAYQPIIGYSTKNHFEYTPEMTNFTSFLDEVYHDMKTLVQANIAPFANEWKTFSDAQFNRPGYSAMRTDSVGPFLKTTWNQTKFYNDLFPEAPKADKEYNKRTPVGCTNVAIAQLMKFYSHPKRGNGKSAFFNENGVLKNIDFESVEYNWNNLPDFLIEPNDDVAKLMYHLARAAKTELKDKVSITKGDDMINALNNNFDYYTKHIPSKSLSKSTWIETLKSELRTGNPFWYQGAYFAFDYGHAWVCDGFKVKNNETHLHMNWGWGGKNDDYYIIRDYWLGGINVKGYSKNDAILVRPRTSPPKNITATKGTFSNKVKITWNKADERSGKYFIVYRNSENNVQTSRSISEWMYDSYTFEDNTANTGEIYFYWVQSAEFLKISLESNSPKAENISFPSNHDTGYRSIPTTAHCGTQILTQVSGTITDGSKDEDKYGNNVHCSWLIKPSDPNTRYFNIKFSRFDTERNADIVTIYGGEDASGDVLARYSGNYIPDGITVPARAIYVVFTTDGSSTRTGWRMIYTSSPNPISGLSNDEICGAVRLPFLSFPYYTSGSNLGATTSSFPESGYYCDHYSKDDVWFVSTIPPRTKFEIRMKPGTLDKAVMVVSSGKDCVRLNSENLCDDGKYSWGKNSGWYISESANGMPYLRLIVENFVTEPLDANIRIFGQNGKTGTFEIAVIDQGRYFNNRDKLEARSSDNMLTMLEYELPQFSVSLQPNPAYDNTTLQLIKDENEKVEIRITDITGKEYYQGSTIQSKVDINTDRWPIGMYVINVSGKKTHIKEKLLVTH